MNGQETVVVDVETYKGTEPVLDATKNYFTLGVIYQANDVSFTFHTPEAMWLKLLELKDKCQKRNKKLTVYGHNLRYDFYNFVPLEDGHIRYFSDHPFIASYIEKEEREFTKDEFVSWKRYADSNTIPYTILNDELGFVLVETEKESISFIDSMALFPMSLKKLGELIGIPKLELPVQQRLSEGFTQKLEYYCINDCRVVSKGIQFLKNKLKNEGISIKHLYTISQIAIQTVLHYLKADKRSSHILIKNKMGKFSEYVHKTRYPEDVHQAYRGGYVRAWKLGTFLDCYAIDVNSLYPYSAMQMRFPDLRTERKVYEPLHVYSSRDLFNKIGVSKVLLKNESNDLGLIMIRTKTKSYVPLRGKYMIGVWTHTELQKALREGYTLEAIEWSILYDEGINVLTDVYKELYAKRTRAHDAFDMAFYKNIMNRSIGKFGQHHVYSEYFIDSIEESWRYKNSNYELIRTLHDTSYDMFVRKKPPLWKRKKYYAPIIPALVTAYARCLMYDYYKKIPQKKLIYSDTDSIIFTGEEKDLSLYPIHDRLGGFKIEKDIETNLPLSNVECVVWGTKSKAIGHNIAVSGAYTKGITLDNFKEGYVPIRKMKTLKQTDLLHVGMFSNETKDLHKQAEEFLAEKKLMDDLLLYIDEGITNIHYFSDFIDKRITNEIRENYIKH